MRQISRNRFILTRRELADMVSFWGNARNLLDYGRMPMAAAEWDKFFEEADVLLLTDFFKECQSEEGAG